MLRLWQRLGADGQLSCPAMLVSVLRYVLVSLWFWVSTNLKWNRTNKLRCWSAWFLVAEENPARMQYFVNENYKGSNPQTFLFQVVELDFLYPSEGIHMRWDNGYRITATAATWDQAAFILSVPRRKPTDETQETLRTSAFPSQHVKVAPYIFFIWNCELHTGGFVFVSTCWSICLQDKWSKNLYLASICYGRSVSWSPFF